MSPAIMRAAWAAAGLGPRSNDCWSKLVVASGNWTMGWAMGGPEVKDVTKEGLLLAGLFLDGLPPGLEVMGGA